MKLFALKQWVNDDSGAVTVDWVVLTAAVVGLGLASVAAVSTGAVSLGDGIDSALGDASVAALASLGDGTADTVRTLLSVSQETYDGWAEAVATYTDEQLATYIAGFATYANAAIESGNAADAAYYIDVVAVYSQEIESRGNTVPDGVPSVPDLENDYNAMV